MLADMGPAFGDAWTDDDQTKLVAAITAYHE